MFSNEKNKALTWILTGMRISVGWYFLYEGIDKLLTSGWSAEMYLMDSRRIFSDLFRLMAKNPVVLTVVNQLNILGLILIGLSLVTGLLVRCSSIAGSLLMLFYFMAYPPIPGYTMGTIAEGSYLWVNKTLILLFIMLGFIFIPANLWYGLARLIRRRKKARQQDHLPPGKEEISLNRRKLLHDLVSIPILGAFGYAVYKKRKWDSFEKEFLQKDWISGEDAHSGATYKKFHFASLNELKTQIPKKKIGNIELTRLIIGSNMIHGGVHSRDLIYVPKLVKAYNTDEKVMMTLQMAEECGINAIVINPSLGRIINKYWHETGGKIQLISDCGYENTFEEGVKMSVDIGAHACYCHGGVADTYVAEGRYDEVHKGIEEARRQGLPVGIGGHKLETVKGMVQEELKPDFWMKTLHHLNYWSATPTSPKRGLWCENPEETIEFMNTLEEPWIAFKTLAAGAFYPEDGFRYAFENGADFICVGMFDYELVEDSNIVIDILNSDILINRRRRWMA
jgi:uncharacterized membrane protein YphA (DoxX/SURF4 family)